MFSPFAHWRQFKAFIESIDKCKDEGCWPWKGETDQDGFGIYKRGSRPPEKVHKLSWKLFDGGPIPAGVVVIQTCGNKLCANPKHLTLNKE